MSKDQKSLNVLVYWLASAFGSEAELIIMFFIMKKLIVVCDATLCEKEVRITKKMRTNLLYEIVTIV